jgi:Flp pilus assembly protein TadG
MREQQGQALVEFALASLLFFTVFFGTIDFGMAVWKYNMVSNLAQEGARWAAVRGSTSSLPHANSTNVQTYVQSRAVGMTVTATPTWKTTANPGETVSVEVSCDYRPLTSFIPSATLTLRSTATMVISR